MNRREFLLKGALGTGAALLPQTRLAFRFNAFFPRRETLNFGILADVHHGMMPDTEQRLSTFMEAARKQKVDFIIQLGDFCHKQPESKSFLKTWNQFKGPKYHVLGNHDMDLSSKAEIMEYWEMSQNYYTFTQKGIRFVVLDANYLYQDGQFIDYSNGNFYVDNRLRTYIDNNQIEWFEAVLENATYPVIVFSHQSLWHYQGGVKNRLSLQKIMEKHQDKIICCFNGHNHIDFHHQQNGIHYVEINSMSYQWVGDQSQVKQTPPALLEQYKWLNHLAPYQDPLYAFASLDPAGSLEIKGVRSQWVSPSPTEMGLAKQVYGNEYSPEISDYKIEF